ncbi:MAG TPA: sigma-70 family RNA polymerase sigma factor [Longimicrobium sp.]
MVSLTMLDAIDPRTLFLDSLPRIEAIAASLCRLYNVRGDEADDFVSWVRERLIENDYAVLGKYRGESELSTFLTVVITRLFHAHGRERMGRWRNSAEAERLGPVARELETLVFRDGCRLHEAAERMRTAGRTTMSDIELARLLDRLPVRRPLRPHEVGDEPLESAQGDSRADERVSREDAARHRSAVLAALFRVLERLGPEERMIVKMHLQDGTSVADVARALHLDQRALYRRIHRIRDQLRGMMEGEGVSRADVREFLDPGGG